MANTDRKELWRGGLLSFATHSRPTVTADARCTITKQDTFRVSVRPSDLMTCNLLAKASTGDELTKRLSYTGRIVSDNSAFAETDLISNSTDLDEIARGIPSVFVIKRSVPLTPETIPHREYQPRAIACQAKMYRDLPALELAEEFGGDLA